MKKYLHMMRGMEGDAGSVYLQEQIVDLEADGQKHIYSECCAESFTTPVVGWLRLAELGDIDCDPDPPGTL